jgi:hypothetical protein
MSGSRNMDCWVLPTGCAPSGRQSRRPTTLGDTARRVSAVCVRDGDRERGVCVWVCVAGGQVFFGCRLFSCTESGGHNNWAGKTTANGNERRYCKWHFWGTHAHACQSSMAYARRDPDSMLPSKGLLRASLRYIWRACSPCFERACLRCILGASSRCALRMSLRFRLPECPLNFGYIAKTPTQCTAKTPT